MNAVECDLLSVGWDIMEVSIDEGTPGVDSICGRIRRQLEGLRLHY